jgi:hypothetical protein
VGSNPTLGSDFFCVFCPLFMKRSRLSDSVPAASAPPEPVDSGEYEPLSFEEALAEARPRADAASQRKELFVGNLDRRVTE